MTLTQIECEVSYLVSCGLRNQRIADYLAIDLSRIVVAVSRILKKTGLSNRTELAVKFLKGEIR